MNEHPPHDDDDDLRRLLHHAVDDVDPAPALDHIRDRTKVTPMSDKRPWLYGFLGAAVATAATVVAVTVLSDDTATPVAGPGENASAEASASPEPSESAGVAETTPPAPETSDATEAPTETVPVYYAGRTPAGVGLFREFHRALPLGEDLLVPALTEALQMPSDPDYFSLWERTGASVGSTFSGGTVVIGIGLDGPPSLAERPAGLDADEARLAVQQLVYTATAALQRNVPVEFKLNGRPADTVLGVDVAGGIGRGGEAETLAPVWVTSPQDGDVVGSSFTVEGQGAFFEATASWQLLDASGEVVQDGFTTAQECCVMAPYRFEVEGVDPGDYTLRVYQAATSGEGGTAEPEDTKRLVVR